MSYLTLPYNKNCYKQNCNTLLQAIEENNVKLVLALLDSSIFGGEIADVNCKDDTGKTPLMHAAENGRVEIVEILLENDAYIDDKDNTGKTALMYAAENGHVKIVEMLISKTDLSNTLLQELVRRSLDDNETDMFKILLKNGAKKLKELNLQSTEISDISPLSNLENLEKLELDKTQVSDISPLSNLKNLKELYLSWTKVSDLSPLEDPEGPVNLEELNLCECRWVSDISPLSKLVNLRELNLWGCHWLSDISPLSNLVNLGYLDLRIKR